VIARCAHRNICRIFGAVIDPENFSLVLEFCSGGTLSGALQESMLDPRTIVDWAIQIAKGMSYLHNDSHQPVTHPTPTTQAANTVSTGAT
jgi:serine/threonine protein kinase